MKKLLISVMAMVMTVGLFAQEQQEMIIHMKDKTTKVINVNDIDSITFVDHNGDTEQLYLSFRLDELTPAHATYTITANQNEDGYYQFLMSKETYDKMIAMYGTLTDHDQAWWQALAEYYENMTWEDVMRQQTIYGTQTFSSDDIIPSLEPETEYIIYYYGIDNAGNATTPVYEESITTPKPAESDNTFEIENISPLPGGVYFTVIPATDDTYYATAQRKTTIDSLIAQGNTMREIAQHFINIEGNYGDITTALHTGEERIYLSCGLDDTDYVIVVCGYDGGVSTDVYTANFHSL